MKTTYLLLILFFLGFGFANGQTEISDTKKDTLVVGYNINAPFIYEKDGKVTRCKFTECGKKITENDNTFYKFKNYPLDKLLLGLTNGSIDIGLSPLTITGERIKKN